MLLFEWLRFIRKRAETMPFFSRAALVYPVVYTSSRGFSPETSTLGFGTPSPPRPKPDKSMSKGAAPLSGPPLPSRQPMCPYSTGAPPSGTTIHPFGERAHRCLPDSRFAHQEHPPLGPQILLFQILTSRGTPSGSPNPPLPNPEFGVDFFRSKIDFFQF